MNTQNNKFTFNKKGFALSLACVGLLATAGNADITGGGVGLNGVTATGVSDYFLGATGGLTGDLTVTGTNASLNFYSGAGTGSVTQSSGATIAGTGSITNLNLYNVSGSLTFFSGSALNVNVNSTNVNLGVKDSLASGALTFSGGTSSTISFGSNKFGTIGLNNVAIDSAVSVGIINAGTVNNFNVEKVTFKDSTASFSISNAGSITNFNNNGALITAGTDAAKIEISNTGTITNFNNKGTLAAFSDSAGVHGAFDIKNNGLIGTFANTGLIDYVTINQNASGALTAGTITTFNNAGVISNSTITGGNIGTFDNTGAVKASTFTGITFGDFTNKGTISNSTLGSGGATIHTSGAAIGLTNGALVVGKFSNISEGEAVAKIENSTINVFVTNSFDNSGVISPIADSGAFILVGGERTPTLTAANQATGSIANTKFVVDKKISSFNNAGTITASTFESGGAAGGNIATFDNTGRITNSTLQNIAIGTLNNNGVDAEISETKLNNLKITTLNNSGFITNKVSFSGGSIDTLNNSGTFDVIIDHSSGAITTINNATTGVIDLRIGAGTQIFTTNIDNKGSITFDSTANIIVRGSTFEKPTGNIINAGSIVGARGAGTDGGGVIAFDNFVNTFENTATGVVDSVNLKNNINGSGAVINFKNAGNMVNINTTNTTSNDLRVTHFTNTGYIGFGSSGSLTLFAKTTGSGQGGQGSFTNSGTIENLDKILARTSYSKFDNSGKIITRGGGNLLEISGGSLDFINSGIVELTAEAAGTAGTAIKAVNSATSGSRVTIINSGELRLANRAGNHIDLTDFKKEPGVVTIKEWHLTDIGDSYEFNTIGNANLTDKVIVKGFSGASISSIKSKDPTTGKDVEKVNSFTTDTKLKFNAGSIVIDPVKNARIVAGQTYDLDKIVTEANGAPVEKLNEVRAEGTPGVVDEAIITNIYKAVQFANESGQADPRLVTISTLKTTDPMFVIQGVDKYDAYGNLVGITDIDTPIEGEISGGATTDPNDTTATPNTGTIGYNTKKAEGDGIIDAFTVKVDGAKSAAAVTVKNAVSQTITRNAFINNVVTTAVNTALSTLNPMNRVSSNDSDSNGVDFSKLEKYAQVTSDGAGYSYEKDTQVFVMPYFRSTSIDLETGDKLNGDTYGIVLGGQKVIAGNGGVIGLFLGYEVGSADSNYTDVDDTTMFLGANYYKTLGGTATYDYYLKGMLRVASISSDITRRGQTNGVGQDSSSDSMSYGIQAALGANIYDGIHTITPEFAVSYDKLSVDGFRLGGIDYDDTNVNLPVMQLGVNWLAQFSNAVSTNLGAGFRYNLQDKFDARINLLNATHVTKTSIDDFYFFLNAGVNFVLTPNWDLSVIYTGDFASDAEAHSGFLKIGYSW